MNISIKYGRGKVLLSAEFNIFFSIGTKNNPRPCYSSIAIAHAQAIY